MHIVVFFSMIAVYGRLDAATTTKIKYLPNGQIGGYELVINNTAPGQKLRAPGLPVPVKQANKILKTASTFTRIDERIEGENVFVNIQSLITKPKETPRYPVSAILNIPSVRHNANGVAENVKLTFAKIGPYAALIVPDQNPGELTGLGNDDTIPPEIRNSVKAFIEVSDRPVPKQKFGYSYPPKISAGVPSMESRARDREVVGGSPRGGSRFGIYEPAMYGNYSRDVGSKDGIQISGNPVQESSLPLGNPAISRNGTVQKSNGLLITLPNKNFTLFAPSAERKLNTDKSEDGSNLLYPYGPTERSSKPHEEVGKIARNNAHTVESQYYYSFLLSEQPPSVRSVKENAGLKTGLLMMGSTESSRSQSTPYSPSITGDAVSGGSRAVESDTDITKEQLPRNVDTPYDLPIYRNSVHGDIEQPIASQKLSNTSDSKTLNGVSTTSETLPFRNPPPNELRLKNVPVGV